MTAIYSSTVLFAFVEPGTRTLLTDDCFFCPVSADDVDGSSLEFVIADEKAAEFEQLLRRNA